MEQKMRAPKLSIWLLAALLAAVVASAHGWSLNNLPQQGQQQRDSEYTGINFDRSNYKGCVQRCASKSSNSIFKNSRQSQQSTFSSLSGLFRKARSIDEQDDQSSAQFELGKTYSYRVETSNEVRTIFALDEQKNQNQQDEQEQNTRDQLIGVKATAMITPISECEVSMQLKNIKINLIKDNNNQQEDDEQQEKQAQRELIRQLQVPILFQYENGVVAEVCTDSEEDQFALNLKKSIISALQTTPRLDDNSNTDRVKVIEPDFNGECETEYSVEKQSRDKFVVRKHKDLSKCANAAEREDTYSSWKNALLKHNPDAVQKCQQSIENRQIQSAQCQSVRTISTMLPHFAVELVSNVELRAERVMPADEQSAQVPARFSRHAHRLMMSRPESYFGAMMKRSHQQKRFQSEEQLQDGRVQLKQVLDELCDDIQQQGRRVSTKTVQFVAQLADTLQRSSQDDVQFVWRNIVQQGQICGAQAKKVKDIFVDTAASVMDRASAMIVRDELLKYIERAQQQGDKTALKRAQYLATLVALSNEPTAEAVRAVVPELLEKIDDAHIVLALSSLVQKTKQELTKENQTQLLESLYETVLRKVYSLLAKDVNEQEVNIIRLFNALENIEPQTQVAGQERLAKIATDSRLPTSVRIATIKSLESIEMEPKLRQTLLQQIFADQSEKNEARIAAYRTLIKSDVTVPELKQILSIIEQDQQNQDVRNYVASHQKNLRTTDDLEKRALLPLDAPLFPEPQSLANFALSRNFDYTYVCPKTQVGAIVEADLIMEKDSRVPKAVTFNLTVPVAEQQLPIVEVTIRQQGLERSLLERLDKIKQLKSPRVMLRELTKMVRNSQKQYQQQETKNQDKDAKIQMILNVDGKNVFVWDSVECAKEHNQEQFESLIAQIYKRLPVQIDETMVVMPLKHQVRLPTASGIPVNFELNTTIIASLEASLKGNSQQQQGGESVLEMFLKPTFVVELGVGLEADIPSASATKRVQFVNRFISAPTVHLKTAVKDNGKKIRVKVLMPEAEQIVARFETEFNNDQDEQVQLIQSLAPAASGLQRQMRKALHKRQQQWYRATGGRDGQEERCLPLLDQAMGFTYCVQHFSVQDLKQSLASKQARKLIYQSEVKLVKTDRQMEGIEIGIELPELFANPNSSEDELKFALHFDTPNSQTNRRFNTDLIVRLPQSAADKFLVQLDIDSPLKKVSGQVLLLNTEQQKGLKIELITDRDQRQFLLEANALVAVQDKDNSQVKVQLRLQPTAHSKMTELQGELNIIAQTDSKKKVDLKLVANEKEVFALAFVKAGSLLRPVDLKVSATFKLDMLGAQVESQALLNKNQATGTIKSTGQLKYNRFLAFSRRARSTEETIAFQLQYSGFNNQQEAEVKKFVHWTLQSSQFPRLNQELTYNIKGQVPEEFSQEFKLKWDAEEEGKRVHIVHESKQLQNARTRNVKHQSVVEIEITPLNLHYDAQLILDLDQQQSQEQSQPKNFGAELKATNRKTSEVAVEGRFQFNQASRKPLQIEIQGELKLRNGQYVLQVRDTLQEVNRGVFEAKTEIELPEELPSALSWLPKKIVRNATYKKLSAPVERIPEIADRPLQKLIAKIVNNLEQVEQELVIECPTHGHIRLHSIMLANEQNEVQIKSELERNQRPVYKAEAEIIPRQRSLKLKFEAEKLDQLQVEVEAQLKGEQKMLEVKVENRKMQHQTRLQADKQEKKLELACVTKKNQQVVFELDAKKQHKFAQLKVKSRFVEAEIELDNVQPRLIRSMMKKRSIYGDEQQQGEASQAKILVKLPIQELEHKTEVQLKPAQRQLTLTTETRKEERNLFKAQLRLQPEEKSIDAEYKVGYITKVKLTKQQQDGDEYEFIADYRVEPKQWIHKTQAKWQFAQKSAIPSPIRTSSWTQLNDIPARFRLISLEMKNHLGPKNVFDLAYKCNEQNPSAEYAHQFFVSTRDSHAELHCSRLIDADQEKYQPKILFTLKSKKFGGVEHKTELKEVNLEKRTLKLYSNTLRQGEPIAEVECELALKQGQQSRVKVQLANRGHKLEMQFVPIESLEAQIDYANAWQHEIKFDRQARQQQWTLKVESANKRKGEKWNVQTRHQCDEFTTVELDTPLIRGQVEVRLDETKKVHIELKGDRKWAGLQHKTDAVWQPEQNKVQIKSNTVKQGKPFVFVDAELYASTERTSTLKVEIEPLELKVAIECDPKVGGELQLTVQEWRHQMQIKKRSSELVAHSETRKDNEVVALVDTELSPRKVQLKVELAGIKKFSPISLKGKIDLDEKEASFQAHHKRSDRKVKLEAKMRDLKNIHIEFAWDAARDASKQVLVQVQVQDKQTAPERFVASIRGDIVDRPFEVKIDVPRQVLPNSRQWIGGSHHIEAEMKNRKTGDQYIVKYIRKYAPGARYQSWVELRKNDFTLIKSDLTVQFEADNKKVIELKTESDYKIDALNVQLEMTRECAYKQCEIKATAVYGHTEDEKKQIKFEGANVADAVRGQLTVDSPRFRAQTIKFEYIKPESKLQVNVFNQAGRQLDLNVDLARPLQKKFQIESFLESIPTVDIEAAHGENSRLVIAVSFQQEKKMELAINWFGQWRRDFKLEALFKCFSKPSVEMLITSRHPEGQDEFDAMLKVDANEYVAKWTRKFDEDKKNWNTQTLIQMNGEKKVDLKVACETKQVDGARREIKTYKAQLDGVRRATGQLTMAIRKQTSSSRWGMPIEMVQAELTNQKQERVAEFNLYLGVRDEQQSAIRTGIKLAAYEKPIFGLVHLTNDRVSGDNKRSSMVRFELPDQIEYVLRNEIEYESRNPEEIKSIRSELKKKQQTIYKTKITFTEDKEHDMKVARIEVHSAQFEQQSQSPKIIEIRYNFEPKQCKTLHLHQYHQHEQQKDNKNNKQQRTFSFAEGQNECWQVEILAGSAQKEQQQPEQFEAEKQYDFKIGAEYVKYPIDSRHFNRTIRFTIESGNQQQNQQDQELTLDPINFTIVGHVSCRSAGLAWDNHNRHGQHKSGMVHVELERLDSRRNMVNVYVRDQNRRQPSKDTVYDLHFVPTELRRSVRMNAKWDQERVRRWIVGEMPMLKDMMRGEKSMRAMKSRMIREIRDEIAHKMAYMRESYHNDLVRPIMQEAEQVQAQMWESESRIAREMSKLVKRAADKIGEAYEQIDIEESLEQLVQTVADSIQSAKREAMELIADKCQQNQACRQLVDQIRDYEIEKFVQEQIVERVEKMHSGLKRAIPSELLESVQELASQFNKAHDDEYQQQEDDDDNDDDEQKKNQSEKPTKSNRWMIRHGARLLKMSQPEMSETFMKHMNKMSKHFNKRHQSEQDIEEDDDQDELDFDLEQPEQYTKSKRSHHKRNQDQQMKIDWQEVRGTLHDMAVDVIDKMQAKANETKQQVQPMWAQFIGGFGGGNQKQQGAGAFDYSNYASKFQQQWGAKKNQQQQKQDNNQDQDDIDDNSSKDNFVFSPKRGEFKLFDTTATKAASSSYWTRA